MLSVLSIAAMSLWLLIVVLPWRPWSTREVLEYDSGDASRSAGLEDVTVVIPARNEAQLIHTTLLALAAQGPQVNVIVIDDHSDDGTAAQAGSVNALEHLEVIPSDPLPEGWSGKLWALQQGLARVRTRYMLLLDADISVDPGVLATLLAKLRSGEARFVSVMASLRMESVWERLLMPAFIFYFRMLYPFQLANSADRRFAAAAGGCIVLETETLRSLGGFAAIRGAVIDDCALAACFKNAGYRTWIGLSHRVVSLRRYERLAPIWEMVARTAYAQLRYSPLYLVFCIGLLVLLYWIPVLAILAPAPPQLPALISCAAMYFIYLPTLRFYGINPAWGLTQPLIASLYLMMTFSSALRYWRGERSRWKGRVYR